MSGIELAGLVVGVVPAVFQATIKAWKMLDDTISFADDSEDLIIRLETVKAHLGIWAAKAGLTEGELVTSLSPFEELIAKTLSRICDLVNEVERKGAKYGLVADGSEGNKRKSSTAAIIQMRKSLRAVISGSQSTKMNITARMEAQASQLSIPQQNTGSSASSRMYWAIHDKQKFEHFIDMLEKHVSGLQSFVVEDRRKMQQEGTRLALEIIRGISEPKAISQLRDASGWNEDFSQMDVGSLAQWKAITLFGAPPLMKSPKAIEDWNLAGSHPEDRAKSRFVRRGQIDPDVAYLFEKKEYDPNISDHSKDLLQDRIRQLIALLGKSKPNRHLHTLQALEYVDDLDHNCWWIVFRFPINPLDTLDDQTNQPLSLRALYSAPYKPALEARYKLAKRLVDTFARLYGSDWMHKGINSQAIIFPHLHSMYALDNFKAINTALVQGFNYSRQRTQAQTIDRGKILHDLEAAIYRHPLYQGEAASGYQIHYDIYSLGLVLFEIALWSPLIDILAAKFKPGKEPPVALSPDMPHFHELEACELKRRVDIRIEHELAYRVGTKYSDLVKWCLNLKGPVTAVEFYNEVAIPLDDLCSQ